MLTRAILIHGAATARAALAVLVLVGVLAACSTPLASTGFVRVTTQGVQTFTVQPGTLLPPASATLTPPPSVTVQPSPTLTAEPSSTPALATPSAEPSLPAVIEASLALVTETTPTPDAETAPTPDAQAATRQVRLPILMYHYVEPWPADAGKLREGLTVRPEDFAAQMAYLHDHGYVTVSLYDLVNALALGQSLPDKAVVLTFDDGYRSLMDYAVPVLAAYGYTGTVFVITQLMDEGFPQYLTWPQAESLYAQGWKIEPHTKTHEQLQGRDRAFQLYQMLGSMQTVQAHIGRPPRFLAYPSGRYDELTVELAKEMHLWGGVTAGFGRVHTLASAYTLTRVRVSGTGTLADFVSGLEGNWVP